MELGRFPAATNSANSTNRPPGIPCRPALNKFFEQKSSLSASMRFKKIPNSRNTGYSVLQCGTLYDHSSLTPPLLDPEHGRCAGHQFFARKFVVRGSTNFYIYAININQDFICRPFCAQTKLAADPAPWALAARLTRATREYLNI